MTQLSAHVVCREWTAVAVAEQQRVESWVVTAGEAPAHGLGCERWDRDRKPGLRGLRVILPRGRLTPVRDDGAADADRRCRAHDADIAPSWPSGFGQGAESPVAQSAIAVRIAFTSAGVSAFDGVCGRRKGET